MQEMLNPHKVDIMINGFERSALHINMCMRSLERVLWQFIAEETLFLKVKF